MPVFFSKDDLEAKVLPDVKKIAKKLDIKNYSKLKKAEIIALILKHPFNKSGSAGAELVIVSPKKSQPKKAAKKKSTPKKKATPKQVAKKKSTPKKKKSSPKKKKSPGFFDKVKEFFSPTETKPKKKAAKKKKTSQNEPKVAKVKSSPKPKKVAKAVEKTAGKRTPAKRRPRKTKAEKEQKIVNALKIAPKLFNPEAPIVVEQLKLNENGKWKPIKQIAPKALPEPVKVLKLKSRSKSSAKVKPLVVKETTVKVTPKKAKVGQKAKTIKKLDINLPSGEKASVLEIPSLRKSQIRASPGSILKNVKQQQVRDIDQTQYFKVGAVKKQAKKNTVVVGKKSSQVKLKTVQKRQKKKSSTVY